MLRFTAMMSAGTRELAAAAQVADREAAEALFARCLNPAMVRAVTLRADALRFRECSLALGVVEAAINAFGRLPLRLQRPGIACLIGAVHGSILRTLGHFDESELALAMAAQAVPRRRSDVRADLKRRFAYLRADQGKVKEARRLVASFLVVARRSGGRTLGKELVNAGAILMLIKDYRMALAHFEEALPLLVANGDRRHTSAIYNLASCHFELASSRAELFHALDFARQAAELIEPGSYNELKLRWLVGRLQHRLGQFDGSLELLESARQGIDERGDGYDRALLVLDIAELHLDRGDAKSAQELARSSFSVLSTLRRDEEAYKAMQIFYRAGIALALDRAVVHTVRHRLLELQRRPRRAKR